MRMHIEKGWQFTLIICFMMGCLFMLCGCNTTQENADVEYAYEYEEQDGEVWLKLSDTDKLCLRFGKDAVTVYETYRYPFSVKKIVEFIMQYKAEKGLNIQRTKQELMGEIRLHNLLYIVGYERARTENTDLEYTADGRWYVNVASAMLG